MIASAADEQLPSQFSLLGRYPLRCGDPQTLNTFFPNLDGRTTYWFQPQFLAFGDRRLHVDLIKCGGDRVISETRLDRDFPRGRASRFEGDCKIVLGVCNHRSYD
jgi:hypothetical protein